MSENKKIVTSVKKKAPTHKVLSEFMFVLFCALLAIPGVLLGYSGIFRSVDYLVEDKIYQNGIESDPGVVIIGITAEDAETYGMYNDVNQRFYDLVKVLYDNEQNRPLVLGIDYQLQYVSDVPLSEEFASYCADKPIVFSQFMNLTDNITVEDDGNYRGADEKKIRLMSEPFYELRSNSNVGYSNLFYDVDGVLRHYSWEFTDKENKTYDSFAKKVYELYGKEKNIDLNPIRTSGESIGYIKYYGTTGRFFKYSLRDILTGNFNSEDLKDKVVLVGEYDSVLTQGYITSISRTDLMYNVEIQANAIADMIEDRQIIEVPMIIQLAFLFVLSTIAIYCLLRLKFIWASIYLFVALFINLTMSNISWSIGHPFHLLYLTVSYIVEYMVCLGIGLQKEKSSKNSVISKFEKTVDKNITSAILDEEESSEPRNKNICIMFADLRNFTAVSSSMESKDLVAMLNRYFTEASKCIKENEGTIDKFNGDAIMAMWGAPNDVDDAVFKACKAALEITQKIETLNKKIYEEFDRSLSFGIGINYGEATVGRVGSSEHNEFTAIGDLVNVASRVESLAPRGCVFITQSVKEKLGNRARISSFDHKYSIKGKTDPIEVFLLEAVDPRPGYYDVQKINEVNNESKN